MCAVCEKEAEEHLPRIRIQKNTFFNKGKAVKRNTDQLDNDQTINLVPNR